MEHAGFFVAQQKGYFKEVGIVVDILEGNGAPLAARVVGNGTYKLGVSSGSATVIARVKEIPVVSLAVINQHSPVVIYSLKETNIHTPYDLVGKRIGVNMGGTKHREFQALLKKLDLDENNIFLIGMTEASPAPLLAGQVDAMLGYTEDQPVLVELLGKAVNRISLSDYGIDLYSTNLIVNEIYLKNHQNLIRKFLGACLKGWQHAINHPEEAVSSYMRAHPESNREFNQANFQKLIPILHSPDVDSLGLGAQTSERWTHTQNILFDLGLIDRKVKINQLFTNDFLPIRKNLTDEYLLKTP